MGFSRQEHWSGLPFPSPGDLPNQGINQTLGISYIGRQILYHRATWEAPCVFSRSQLCRVYLCFWVSPVTRILEDSARDVEPNRRCPETKLDTRHNCRNRTSECKLQQQSSGKQLALVCSLILQRSCFPFIFAPFGSLC